MILFDKDGAWNWVDKNNVVLGFRNEPDCCEIFGYRYYTKPPTNMEEFDTFDYSEDEVLDDFNFDTTYFEEFSDSYDGGSNAIFKLVSKDKTLYLLIYNHHNGYYGHGWNLDIGGLNSKRGIL